MKKVLKIILLGIGIVLVSLIGAIGISTQLYANNQICVSVLAKAGTQIEDIKLNDYRLIVEKIDVNGKASVEDKIMSFLEDSSFELKISAIDDLEIDFLNNNGCQISVENYNYEVEDNIFEHKVSNLEILSKSISLNTFIIFIILIPIICGIYFILKHFYVKIKNENINLLDIFMYSLSLFLLYFITYYFLYSFIGTLVIVPIIALVIYNIYIIFKSNKKEYHIIYTLFGTLMGVSMIFALAPLNVPDETSHMFRAYKNSLFEGRVEDDGYMSISKCIVDFSDKFAANVQSDENKIPGRMYLSEIYKICDYEEQCSYLVDYSNVKYLSYVTYIPATIVMFFGIKIGLSPLVILLLSRYLDLLLVMFACFIAIKITPRFKKIFLIVSLFPLFLQQAAAINQDYYINAVSILFIAFILRMIWKCEKITNKEIIITVILSISLSAGKFGYFPITLLLLLIPNEKFKNNIIAWIVKIGSFFGVLVLSFMLGMSKNSIGTEVAQVYGIRYVFTNFFDTIKIFIRTLFGRLNNDIFEGFINRFGYSTILHKSLVNLILIVMYLVLIFIDDENNEKNSLKQRALFILIPMLVIGIIYGGAFTQWTEKGQGFIWGIQSRYFLPVISLLYIGVSTDKFKLEVENKKNLYSILIGTSHILSLITIMMFFN